MQIATILTDDKRKHLGTAANKSNRLAHFLIAVTNKEEMSTDEYNTAIQEVEDIKGLIIRAVVRRD